MSYKSEGKRRYAASNPSEIYDPFKGQKIFSGMNAKNDPVGMEEFKSNPYEIDKKLNWVDRS